MDTDGLREYLTSPFGDVLLGQLEVHRKRAEAEVLRLASKDQYDPSIVRFRAGVVVGIGQMMDAIRQMRKAPDAKE